MAFKPLLSIPKGAALVGVSLDTMRREIAGGGVPTVRVGQRDLLDPDDLEAWRASRRHRAQPLLAVNEHPPEAA